MENIEEVAVPPSGENPAQPEVTPPAEADNGDERDQIIADFKVKTATQAAKLAASKAEALRLKSERDDLLSRQIQPKPADSPQMASDEVELFKQYAKAAGVPLKEDIEKINQATYKSQQDSALEKFLEEHPEYKPENDTDDIRWGTIAQEIALYKAPVQPKDWYALLKKAHSAIQPDNSFQKGKSLGMAQAALNEQARIGGGSSGAKAPVKKLSPEQQAVQEGFKQTRPNYFS